MNKDKLVSLILKKQTYKQTTPVRNLIHKENQQAIKYSIAAIEEILTKQYNTQSKLYAIRFLKDSFQMGSPKFIKSVETSILPILVNIIIDSTDQKAILKYAGSSFTKNSDLSKYKSVVSSMFTMSKQCVYKWAEWLSNDAFKYRAAFISLQKKGVRFDYQFQYFRDENQQIFRQNCKKNNLDLPVSRRNSQKKIQIEKQQKNPQEQKFKLGQRMIKPNTKDKYALHIYDLFEEYDKRLISKQLTDLHIKQFQNKFNELLNFYLQKSNQFNEQYMQECFGNLENIKKDFQRQKSMKITSSNIKSPKNDSQIPLTKTNSLKKIQTVKSNQKIKYEEQMTPTKPMLKTQKPNIPKSPKQIQHNKPIVNQKQFEQEALMKQQKKQQTFQQPSQKSKSRKQRIQKFKNKHIEKQSKNQNSELKYGDSEQSQQNSFLMQKIEKNKQKVNEESLKSKQSTKKVLLHSDNNSYDRQNTNKSSKNNIKEQFDSHLSVSQNSSRVNFSQSSQDQHDQSSEPQPSMNFKKQKEKPKLSSIVQQQNEGGYGETSRNNLKTNNEQQQMSLALNSYKRQSAKILQNYDRKIKQLEKQLYAKNKQNESIQLSLLKTQRQSESKNRQIELLKQQQIKLSKRLQNFANVSADSQKMQTLQNKIYELQQKNKKLESNYQQIKQEYQSYKTHTQKQLQKYKNDLMSRPKHVQQMLPYNSIQNSEVQINKNTEKYFSSPKRVQFNQKQSNIRVQNIRSEIVQKLDSDYANNLTHPSNISNILDSNNVLLFKKAVLSIKNKPNDNKSQLLFTSQSISIAINAIQNFSLPGKRQTNQIPTLKLEFIYQLNNLKSSKPITKFYNIQEIQLWTKPIADFQSLYKQQVVVKVLKFPFRIMKGSIWQNQAQFNGKKQNDQGEVFLLPFMYFSILKHEQFSNEQFDDIFQKKIENIIKSKVISINQKIIRQPFIQLTQIFGENPQAKKNLKIQRNDHNQNKIKFCLTQSLNGKQKDCTFMCEIQILNKYKCLLRVLPIPFTREMGEKTKQLIENVVFLLS